MTTKPAKTYESEDWSFLKFFVKTQPELREAVLSNASKTPVQLALQRVPPEFCGPIVDIAIATEEATGKTGIADSLIIDWCEGLKPSIDAYSARIVSEV